MVSEETGACRSPQNARLFHVSFFITGTIAAGFEDKSAYAQCVFAYTEGKDKPIHIFNGTVIRQVALICVLDNIEES